MTKIITRTLRQNVLSYMQLINYTYLIFEFIRVKPLVNNDTMKYEIDMNIGNSIDIVDDLYIVTLEIIIDGDIKSHVLMSGEFEISPNVTIDSSKLEELVLYNGSSVLWSMCRQSLCNTSNTLRGGAFNLPTMNFSDMCKIEKNHLNEVKENGHEQSENT